MMPNKETTPNEEKINLGVPAHPKYLRLVRNVMEKIALCMGISNEESGKMVLAIDEACTNIIKHSYDKDHSGKIDISFQIEKESLKITIIDYGKSCEEKKIKSRELEDIRPGGLGVHIMKSIMDHVEYSRSSKGENVLEMLKKI